MNRNMTARAILVAIVAILPFLTFISPFWFTLLTVIGISSLVALGISLLTGVGGMTSFGQAAFVGFGAYTTAWLTTALGWPPLLSLPASIAVTGAAAMLIGSVTVRLSGHYLALGTIAWGVALYYLFGNLAFIGGHTGISGIPPVTLFGYSLIDVRAYFALVWVMVILACWGATNLLDSRLGRAFRTLRHGTLAARASGIDVGREKLRIFVCAALLAGLAGWLMAHFQRTVSQGSFSIAIGIEFLLMAVLGGTGSVYGAVLGSALVVVSKSVLQAALPLLFGAEGNYEGLVFGLLLVGVLQVAPGGLWPYLTRRWPRARLVGPEAEGLPAAPLPAAAGPLLEARGIRKVFGGLVAVKDVDFSVRKGEIVGLIGPNGAGKSTTFNLLTGVLTPTAGEVAFCGEPLAGAGRIFTPEDAARHRIARTFQHVKLSADMSVLDNVAIGATQRAHAGLISSLLHRERDEEKRLLAEAIRQIRRVGLADQMHRPAGELALGQQRLVEIARALCLDPVLLLMDEPAAGLRRAEKDALAELLRQLRSEGMSILLVEHDMDFVMKLTDHLVVMNFGAKIAEGTPGEVRRNEAVVKAYLGEDE
ncbi:ABC transporter permease subunit [Allorhizobium pseudoryzae]|uniref:branched-chain amino acid ABC transporter ATP-binding protein/permease n=1 Tax=Allorhizobium pseudoryzae TaxID=379684 RepID=UPI003D08D91B